MDFYTRKQKAINYIDNEVKKGSDSELIVFEVMTLFALSEKFVRARLEQIRRMAKLKEMNKEA